MPIDIIGFNTKGGDFLKKRFISLALALLILISIIPKPIEAKGFTKEIDVIENNIKLQVEGKNVSSKESFIYDGELWIPLKDLAKALGMGVDFDFEKRNFKLKSNGKLNINDSSKANVAFQRGYEIQAKERIIGELDKEIRAFEGKSTSETSSSESIVRNIGVGFSNINFYLDGKKINLDIDPLIYNDDLYVSLVALSPLLYITPSLKGNLVNIDSNAVLVKKDGYNSVDDLAKFRDSLNNRLGIQLDEMEKRKEVLMDVKIPYEEIKTLSAMEKYLNKHLGEIKDLPIDINLSSGSDSWYYIDIDFPSRYNYRWRNLSRRDVEAHVWDIFVAITSLYDEDAKIQGSIRNPNNSRYRDYVTFDTKMKDIVFSFINSNLDVSEKVDPVFIEEVLLQRLGRYHNEYFDFSARISGYDLELLITPQSNAYMRRWSSEAKLRFLREIDYEIKRHYPGLKVNGRIEYPGEDTIHFLIDNGKLSSSYMVDEMVEYLNDRYGVFTVNGLRIPMKYGFHQVDKDNYKLMVDMDFDRNDSNWNQAAEEALGAFLQDVIKEIVSLWDVNIFAQVYDKNQSLVTEFVISQDTVQAVTASPISGNIEEGKSVSLSTNTQGADIYYTTDGTTPSTNGTKYTTSIVINKDTTIKAYAVKDGFKDSPIYEFKYTIVAAGNIATGLDGLSVSEGSLNPSFSKQEYDYTVTLPDSTLNIGIRPTASIGTIAINGVDIDSGQTRNIELKSDVTTVKLVHKENGKTDRVYTIVISKGEEGSSNVKVADYTLSTKVASTLYGRLTGATDFTGYTIDLLSETGTRYETISVKSDGTFEASDFPAGILDKIFGYNYLIKYRNTTVGEGKFNETK